MNIENQYIDLMKDILDNGVTKADRTGTGIIGVFGRQLRHNLAYNDFPLLTTKSVPLRVIAVELIWFLLGRTDLRWLVERKCYIWVGDAYKKYKVYAANLEEPDYDVHIDDPNLNKVRIMTEQEFIDQIIEDDEFSKRWGDLGPIYGKQWRRWETPANGIAERSIGSIDVDGNVTKEKILSYDLVKSVDIDQISNVIEQLKKSPDSRRIMVTAWNPPDIPNMTLPPCHYGFQFYTRPFTEDEKRAMLKDVGLDHMTQEAQEEFWQRDDVPKRMISLMWNQRSVDTPLGLPFNIASYALLLEIIAAEVNMVPYEIICNLGDTHIYLDQVEGAKEQVTREPYKAPKLVMKDEFHYLFEQDIPFTEKLERLDASMFKVENYKKHPKINYPLSN